MKFATSVSEAMKSPTAVAAKAPAQAGVVRLAGVVAPRSRSGVIWPSGQRSCARCSALWLRGNRMTFTAWAKAARPPDSDHPPLSPGCVFIEIASAWHGARWSPGINRLVMSGDHPAHEALYRKEGYVEVAPFNDERYAHH
jgi:hypothetical protein